MKVCKEEIVGLAAAVVRVTATTQTADHAALRVHHAGGAVLQVAFMAEDEDAKLAQQADEMAAVAERLNGANIAGVRAAVGDDHGKSPTVDISLVEGEWRGPTGPELLLQLRDQPPARGSLPATAARTCMHRACLRLRPTLRPKNLRLPAQLRLAGCLAPRPHPSPSATLVLAPQRRFGMMGTTDNPGGMKANASAEELSAALKDAIIIDVRSPPEIAKGPAVPGSLNLVWDRDADTMPVEGLPEDLAVPLFVH